jgi:hypothetical protein
MPLEEGLRGQVKRGRFLSTVLVAAAAAACVAPAASASLVRYKVSDLGPGLAKNEFNAWERVRNGPPDRTASGYVIGNLHAGSTVDAWTETSITDHQGIHWIYGYAYGNLQHCGWVRVADIYHPSGAAPGSPSCPRGSNGEGHIYTTGSFMRACSPGSAYCKLYGGSYVQVNCTNCGTTSDAVIDYRHTNCTQPGQAWNNANPFQSSTTPHDPISTILPDGWLVGWRYVTRDGNYVQIQVKTSRMPSGWGGSNWVFVRRNCILLNDPPTAWINGHGIGSSNQLLGDVSADGRDDAVAFFNNGACTAYCGAWYVAPSSAEDFSNFYQAAYGHGVGSTNQFLADVNGDRGDDAIVYFQNTGSWYVAASHGTGFNNYYQAASGHGIGSSNRLMGDVNGDGRADAVAFFNNGSCTAYCGAWYVALSNGFSFNNYYQAAYGHGVGSTNQFLADVNGDGRDDAIVYFQSNGCWYVAPSNGSGFNNYYQGICGHGVGSDNRLMADVNGDGRDDAVVYFRNTGSWYVALSNGFNFNNYYLWRDGFGAGSDRQFLGDADGDGSADAVAYFAGTGSWYVWPAF